MDKTQRCFSIEREGNNPIYWQNSCLAPQNSCLANFKDEFVFLFTTEGSYRCSLAKDKWEELPISRREGGFSACSLGDKVYVFTPADDAIEVLHNPDALVSSQEMHWQVIELPLDVQIPCSYFGFAPLNSTEIVIAGGMDRNRSKFKDIMTFDTTTCEFKREILDGNPLFYVTGYSANLR